MYYIVYNNKTPTLSVNLKRAQKLAVLLHTDFKDRHDGTGAIKRDHGGFNRRLIESFNERIKSKFFNKSSPKLGDIPESMSIKSSLPLPDWRYWSLTAAFQRLNNVTD